MSKFLVTGGAGFIGSNFIRYWLAHHPKDKVVNLDKLTYAGNLSSTKDFAKKPRYKFIKGDICDPKIVELAMPGVDIVVHFAAESHVDRSIYGPLRFVQTNTLGTAVLLEVARAHKIKKFIHVSTDEVYGELPLSGKRKFREQSRYLPRSPYSASKAGSDHLVYSYWATYGLPTIITNGSNNVGPYQYPEKFIPLAITNVLEGKPIRVYGQGRNKRDWIWVIDHCRGIEAVIQRGKPGEAYLFGGKDGARFSNLEVAKMILEKMGKQANNSTIQFVSDRPGHDLRYEIDWSKAKIKLGWEPEYNLAKILEATIKWYQENRWWWHPLKRKERIIKYGKD